MQDSNVSCGFEAPPHTSSRLPMPPSSLLTPGGFAAALGVLFLGIVASICTFRLVKAAGELIWRFTFKKPTDFARFGARSGRAWAIVTGSSDGIGREFAVQLAQKKLNVVLAARRKDKLEQVAQECRDAGVKTQVVVCDFSDLASSGWDELSKVIASIHAQGDKVTVLVNNAGVSYEFPMRYDELPADRATAIIEVNVKAVMKMTSLVTPYMIERGNGLILNLGSVVSQIPSAYLAVYSGSKAFLKYWSMAIGQELKETGVLVEHLNTWFVSTAMSKIRKSTWQVPSAKDYVSYALRHAGSGSLSWTPYPSHALFAFIVDNVVTRHKAMDWFGEQQRGVRALAMKKKLEKEKKAKEAAIAASAPMTEAK
ncbi:hypothetical protein DFJ74DRAFT_683461 [Hyaloraphidium curvatum]|nr:hypothetical protein DFJ74DRAFT_683461 [Hyaloraphidium curvatum]